jgi:HlyD family secretion protein
VNEKRCTAWKRKPLGISASALCCLALFLPLAGVGCNHAAKATSEEKVVEVVIGNPQRRDLIREIDQPGWLKPFEQTAIYSKIAGFAREWKVDRGDRVKKDQLLVELYLPEVVQQLAVKAAKVKQTKADLKQATQAAKAAKAGVEAARADIDAKLAAIKSAKAQVRRWEAEDERSRRLVGRGIYDQQTADEVLHQLQVSEAGRDETKAKHTFSLAMFDQASAQFSKAEADVEVAAANIEVAQADYDYWKDWLSYAEIRAPYDGVVTNRHTNTGDFLQPANSGATSKAAEPLFMMMRTDIMRLTLEVPELDAGLIRKGDKARVRFQTKNGGVQEIEAKVSRDSYALDERAHTLTVEVYLDNPDDELLSGAITGGLVVGFGGKFPNNPNGKLKVGTYANVTIFTKLPNVLTLPPEAILNDILQDGDRSYIYVVENDKVHKTFVDVGARGVERVQVLRKQRPGGKWEPFTEKEAIVVVNPQGLLDGQTVQIKKSE